MVPLADGATLIVSADGHQAWRFDCRETPPVAALVASPDAAVDAGKLTADGKTLVYSDGDEIKALELVTGTVAIAHRTPPGSVDSWIQCQSVLTPTQGEDHTTVDGFAGFDEGDAILLVDRTGANCHYPSMWQVRVTDWRDPAKAAEHIARPIYDVVADSAGTLWMIDGGGLWKSRDRGDHWTRVAVKIKKQDDDYTGAPVQIIVDAKHPARLAVRTAAQMEISEGQRYTDFSGRVLRSDNGGKTWRVVPPPPNDWDSESPAIWIAAPDGNVDHLDVGLYQPSSDEPTDDGEPRRAAARTLDGGKTWTPIDSPTLVPTRRAELGGDVFEATNDGLFRTHNGTRTRITGVLAKPYWADLY
jgi:hypothetical protein